LSVQLFVLATIPDMTATDFIHQVVLFFWIASNTIWMLGDYIWSEDQPMGVLMNFSSVVSLDRRHYESLLLASAAVLWGVVAMLFLFYGFSYVRARRGVIEAVPLPSPVYFWWFPWILSEACWVTCDVWQISGSAHPSAACMCVGQFSSMLAMGLCMVCSRRQWNLERTHEAALIFAQFFWVAGNFVWFFNDWLTDGNETSFWTQITGFLFSLGALVALGSLLVEGAKVESALVPLMKGCAGVDLASTGQP